MRKKYAQYLHLNNKVDAQMGQLIGQLEKDGLLDDTFLFHYGDHGGVLPGAKGYAHNDGLQVVMVVYVPKNWQHLVPAKPGTRIGAIISPSTLTTCTIFTATSSQPLRSGAILLRAVSSTKRRPPSTRRVRRNSCSISKIYSLYCLQ